MQYRISLLVQPHLQFIGDRRVPPVFRGTRTLKPVLSDDDICAKWRLTLLSVKSMNGGWLMYLAQSCHNINISIQNSRVQTKPHRRLTSSPTRADSASHSTMASAHTHTRNKSHQYTDRIKKNNYVIIFVAIVNCRCCDLQVHAYTPHIYMASYLLNHGNRNRGNQNKV